VYETSNGIPENRTMSFSLFSNNGNYEKDIVRFSGIPFEVSYTGENIVAVTIYNKSEVVFNDMFVE
jgi:hypothetical protein